MFVPRLGPLHKNPKQTAQIKITLKFLVVVSVPALGKYQVFLIRNNDLKEPQIEQPKKDNETKCQCYKIGRRFLKVLGNEFTLKLAQKDC